MDDALALLVGRVILAFGQLDQALWRECHYLNADARSRARQMGGNMPALAEEIDPRFSKRLSAFRSLLKYYITENPNILVNFDVLRDKIVVVERKRAHLAHGMISQHQGIYKISDARETIEFAKRWNEATLKQARKLLRGEDFERSREPISALRKRHFDITYTQGDLADLASDITSYATALVELSTRAKLEWRKMTPPA